MSAPIPTMSEQNGFLRDAGKCRRAKCHHTVLNARGHHGKCGPEYVIRANREALACQVVGIAYGSGRRPLGCVAVTGSQWIASDGGAGCRSELNIHLVVRDS